MSTEAKMYARVYWQNRARDESQWRYTSYQPHGRITLYRWSEYHGVLYSDAVALAESGRLPGYIEDGKKRWVALDLSIDDADARLSASGRNLPKLLADDLYVNPQGTIRIRPQVGD